MCVHIYTYIYMYVYVYVCIYIYICICVFVYVYMRVLTICTRALTFYYLYDLLSDIFSLRLVIYFDRARKDPGTWPQPRIREPQNFPMPGTWDRDPRMRPPSEIGQEFGTMNLGIRPPTEIGQVLSPKLAGYARTPSVQAPVVGNKPSVVERHKQRMGG